MRKLMTDIKVAANLFLDMRKIRKDGMEVKVERKRMIPTFDVGTGFYDTVEGCTLANCEIQDVKNIAYEAFLKLPYEIKHFLSCPPKDGEFVERALFWNELFRSAMSPKQRSVAMSRILKWYITIKKRRLNEEIVVEKPKDIIKTTENTRSVIVEFDSSSQCDILKDGVTA